jgi:hypothetical protein
MSKPAETRHDAPRSHLGPIPKEQRAASRPPEESLYAKLLVVRPFVRVSFSLPSNLIIVPANLPFFASPDQDSGGRLAEFLLPTRGRRVVYCTRLNFCDALETNFEPDRAPGSLIGTRRLESTMLRDVRSRPVRH